MSELLCLIQENYKNTVIILIGAIQSWTFKIDMAPYLVKRQYSCINNWTVKVSDVPLIHRRNQRWAMMLQRTWVNYVEGKR